MAAINTNLTCDLQKAVKVQYLDGVVFSQDNQANAINVTVLDGGEPATISGTVTANIIRSDGSTVAASGGTITDNVASITLPAAAYAIPGVISVVIKLTTSGVVTTIAAIVANVYESSTAVVIDPGTIIPSVTALISAIETAVASIPADYSSLWTSLAPAFNSSSSYVAGQYVTYNGVMCRFNTPHTGSWAAGDVSVVNIGDELQGLKSAIDDTDLQNAEYMPRHTGLLNAAATSWIYTTDSKYQFIVLPVVPGEVFKLTQTSGHTAYWAFLKSFNISAVPDLSSATPGRRTDSADRKVPSDANYVYIQLNNNNDATIPSVLQIGDWDYEASAKSQIMKAINLAVYGGKKVPLTITTRFIGSQNTYADATNRTGAVFAAEKNKKYRIKSKTNKNIIYALLTKMPEAGDQSVPFSYDGRHDEMVSQAAIIIPNHGNTQYVWILNTMENGYDSDLEVYDMGASDTILIAAADSGAYKDQADYICDGTDDQYDFISATRSLTNGGTVLMAPGNFYFDKFLSDGACVFTGYNNGNARVINYRGIIENKSYNTRFGTTIHVTQTAITNKNTNTTNSVFRGTAQKPSIEEGDYQYTFTYVNNVNFYNFYLYVASAFEGYAGIDCRNYGGSEIKEVCVATEDYFYNRFHHVKQTTPEVDSVGIFSCRGSNDEMAPCSYEDIDVGGMYKGFHFYGIDKLVMRNCQAARCVYGYYFNKNEKTQTMISCSDEGNYNGPYFDGNRGHIIMIGYNVEPSDYYPDDPTGAARKHAAEKTAGAWEGEISYTGQGYKPFWESGYGINFRTVRLESPRVASSAPTNPEPYQTYFDTANNVWKTWNGSAWV